MTLETVIHWLGGLLSFSGLGILLYGVWRGTQREAGRTVGLKGSWLRSPVFYFVASVFFFGLAWLGWIPIPIYLSSFARIVLLIIGAFLLFPGLAFLLWGRLTLGKEYFVSTGLGAQLFKGQHLVTTGPYAIVRHPMYVGLMLAAMGSLLVYMTWTTLYFACMSPFILMRAWREDEALSAEFGEQWKDYRQRVPAFFPRLRKER